LYVQYEGSFSNPNGRINERCLDWLCKISKGIQAEHLALLELYCGCGNHTIALSAYFNKIVAVELDKHLCEAARLNIQTNNLLPENVRVVQIHSEKFCKSLLVKRSYENINFDVVLVDPPRAGLDSQTLKCVVKYPHILYVSCNPASLLRDLLVITETHTVVALAVFDQFATTTHLETAIYAKLKCPL
jgi:tRNA (uracil-5-)-methyltransferase